MEYRDTAKGFLGVGWRFPVEVDPATGRILTASSEEDIRQAIRIILQTGKGERMMRPDFGCGAREYLFSGMDRTTLTQFENEVREALTLWEPRITDVEVDMEPDPQDSARLLVKVAYVVRSTNNPYNLVYPYYLNEGLEL